MPMIMKADMHPSRIYRILLTGNACIFPQTGGMKKRSNSGWRPGLLCGTIRKNLVETDLFPVRHNLLFFVRLSAMDLGMDMYS